MLVMTFGLMLIPATATSPDFSRDVLQWRASLTTNANRLHKDVFPGIDLFYTGDAKTISSVFIVRPEGDPSSVRLEFLTATKLEIDKSGTVLINTNEEDVIRILHPNFHQNLNSQNQSVEGKFVRLDDKHISVQIESYNKSLPLVIQFTSVFFTASSPSIENPSSPFAVTITANLKDSLAGDAGQVGVVNPGDTLRYIVTITNSGTTDAIGVNFTDVLDTSTTSIAGSLKATPVAVNDAYIATYNATYNVPASGVLTNDYGVPSPTATPIAAGVTPHGTVTLSANGSFAYTPTTNYFGPDTFSYTATNTVGSNSAIAALTIPPPAPVANNDAATASGNIQISAAAPGVLGNDVLYGATITGSSTTSAQGGNVTVSADGSYTYNPPAGYEGSDSFTYIVTNTTASDTGTVNITITGMIWFINNNAAAGNGRLTTPFNTLEAFRLVNNGTGNNPAANDNIFVYESATAYVPTATLILLAGQKLIGQDGSASLSSLSGVTPPAGSVALPAMNSGNGTFTIISTTAASTNGITLGSGNTIRGLTVGPTTGAKIFGSSFGTLTVGNNTTPDVTLSGNGQALNLTTGTFAATSGFVSVTSTSSGTQGIVLSSVGGTVAFGSTTISGVTTQGILVSGSTATIDFGNTSITGGTDAVSLQNNSSGTRTFGTLATSGNSATGFLHAVGGGTTTVGATTITNPGGTGIDIQSSITAITFGATTVNKGSSAGTGVNLGGASSGNTADVTFASLGITASNGTGLLGTNNSGQIIVTTATSAISATNGPALNISRASGGNTTVNLNFSGLTSAGTAANGVTLTNVAGTIVGGTGSLIGSGAVVNVSGGTVGFTYSGNVTQANNAAMVSVSGGHTTGTITFQTGTLSATNGSGLQFDNADSPTSYNFNGTTTLNGGDAGIDIMNGSAGTFSFGTGVAITSPTGTAFNIGGTANTAAVTYSGSITKNNAGTMVSIVNHTTGTVTFQTGTLSATTASAGSGLYFDNADGTYNFNGTTTLNGGSAAVNIVNGSGGAFTFVATTAITSPADTAFGVIGGTASVTYSGNITQANNFPMVSVSGGHTTGTITFQTGTLSATNGSGLQFDNADSPTSYNFNGTTTLNGGDAGIDIMNGSAGTFSFASGSSITNPTNEVIKINASTANVTYSGSFNKTNNTAGIFINGETGGTITINGSGTKTLTSGVGNAITLSGNTGATINFSGNNLLLTTTAGTGINATGGGTFSVTGTGNTITSTTGTALNVTSTTIGANDLNFQSISSTGSANGIILNATGSSGGLTVTGTGAANSGGTIQNTTADAIVATSTQDLSLTRILIQGPVGDGINASNLGGTCLLSNSTIQDYDVNRTATKDGYRIINTSTTLTMLTIAGCTFNGTTSTSVIPGSGDGVFMEAQGAGNMSLTVNGNTSFTEMFDDGIQVNGITGATATVNVTVQNCSFTNAAILGNGGVGLFPFGGINMTALIANNTFDNIMLPVTNLGAVSMTNGLTANATITVQNNTMNNLVGSRGITITADGTGTNTLVFDNNAIDRLGSSTKSAISVNCVNTATANVKIRNNLIGLQATLYPGAASALADVVLITSQNSALINVLLSGNNITANTGFEVMRTRAISSSTINATVTGNTLNDNAGTHVEFEAVTGTSTVVGGTICLNISGNIVPAGGVGVIRITENAAPGSINVTQASSAAVSTGNSNATVTLTGTPQFGQPTCTQP